MEFNNAFLSAFDIMFYNTKNVMCIFFQFLPDTFCIFRYILTSFLTSALIKIDHISDFLEDDFTG